MGLLVTVFEAILSAWGWVKSNTAEKLGMAEQKDIDVSKQNQSLQKQLKDAVNPPSAADRLRSGRF